MTYRELPPEIQQTALMYQKMAGNPENLDIPLDKTKIGEGFDWRFTIEGFDFWSNINGGYFTEFYERYPIQIKMAKEQTLTRAQLLDLRNRFKCELFRAAVDSYLTVNYLKADYEDIIITQEHINHLNNAGTTEQKSAVESYGIKFTRDRPKSWEDIIETHGDLIDGYFMDSKSGIYHSGTKGVVLHKDQNKNIFKTMAQAEAMRALAMLSQIIPYYVGDWVPNWNDASTKYVIVFKNDLIDVTIMSTIPHFLAFADSKTALEFIGHPEIAKLITKARPFI